MSNRPLVIPGLIAAVMLFLCLGNHPYGYYTLLRWVVCVASIVFVFYTRKGRLSWMVWLFGFTAILFNPIKPIYLRRETWKVLDVMTAVLFVAGAFLVQTVPQNSAHQEGRREE